MKIDIHKCKQSILGWFNSDKDKDTDAQDSLPARVELAASLLQVMRAIRDLSLHKELQKIMPSPLDRANKAETVKRATLSVISYTDDLLALYMAYSGLYINPDGLVVDTDCYDMNETCERMLMRVSQVGDVCVDDDSLLAPMTTLSAYRSALITQLTK